MIGYDDTGKSLTEVSQMVSQRIALHGVSSNPLNGRRRRSSLRPGPLTRLLARLRAGSLDRALAAGADPAASGQLAARASILTSRRFRRALAEGLERWLQAAYGRRQRRRVLPPRSLATAHAGQVRGVIAQLRGGAPLYAPGVAAVGELLSDTAGPAYHGDSGTLAQRLAEARSAMDGVPRAIRRTPAGIARGPVSTWR
jgi:hypothetical protein